MLRYRRRSERPRLQGYAHSWIEDRSGDARERIRNSIGFGGMSGSKACFSRPLSTMPLLTTRGFTPCRQCSQDCIRNGGLSATVFRLVRGALPLVLTSHVWGCLRLRPHEVGRKIPSSQGPLGQPRRAISASFAPYGLHTVVPLTASLGQGARLMSGGRQALPRWACLSNRSGGKASNRDDARHVSEAVRRKGTTRTTGRGG